MKNKIKFLTIITAISTISFSNTIVFAMKNESLKPKSSEITKSTEIMLKSKSKDNIVKPEDIAKITKSKSMENIKNNIFEENSETKETKNIFPQYNENEKQPIETAALNLINYLNEENKFINSIIEGYIKNSNKEQYLKSIYSKLDSRYKFQKTDKKFDELTKKIKTQALNRENYLKDVEVILKYNKIKNLEKKLKEDMIINLNKQKDLLNKYMKNCIKQNVDQYYLPYESQNEYVKIYISNENQKNSTYMKNNKEQDNISDEHIKTNEENGLLNECVKTVGILEQCDELIKIMQSDNYSFEEKIYKEIEFEKNVINLILTDNIKKNI